MEDSLSMAPTVTLHRNSEIALAYARYYLYCLLSKDDLRNPLLATVYITAADLNVTFSQFPHLFFFSSYMCFYKLNLLETVVNVRGPQRPTGMNPFTHFQYPLSFQREATK